MSGIGHFAAGFAAKPYAPQAPLWVFLVASEANDLLYFFFTAVGVERPVSTTVDFQLGVRYLTAGVNPWSHGLFMSLVWSLAAAALVWLVYRERQTAGLIGLVVFSHWGLDFLMHSNLPLFFAGSPQVGLGLENSGPGFIFITVLDLVLIASGIAIYLTGRRRTVSQTNPQIKRRNEVYTMNDKILVTYTSRTGSTAGVAEAIGKSLAEGGAQVDVLPMQDVKDLVPYRAVVAGSAIQGGKWLPEAMQFIQTHQAALTRKPCAVFLVCMTLAMGNGKYRQEVATWMEPVRRLVHPVSEGLFAGVLDISKVPSFSERLKFRLSVAMGVWSEGDHRDWEAIRGWAAGLRPLLMRH